MLIITVLANDFGLAKRITQHLWFRLFLLVQKISKSLTCQEVFTSRRKAHHASTEPSKRLHSWNRSCVKIFKPHLITVAPSQHQLINTGVLEFIYYVCIKTCKLFQLINIWRITFSLSFGHDLLVPSKYTGSPSVHQLNYGASEATLNVFERPGCLSPLRFIYYCFFGTNQHVFNNNISQERR